ncbi:hypothetical protein PI124_g8440 [Phytophthora idaei]|nr:hypothetical protein PI124_g8440 [Phytophthora idaei]
MTAALAASKAAKAGGPDRFGKDWCRDYAKDLVQILTLLYNLWFAAGVSPELFLEAANLSLVTAQTR